MASGRFRKYFKKRGQNICPINDYFLTSALTTNKGQEKILKDNELDTCCPFFVPEKFKYAGSFSERLEPLVKAINDLLKEYRIENVDRTISFRCINGQIAPFISYEDFPSPLAATKVGLKLHYG